MRLPDLFLRRVQRGARLLFMFGLHTGLIRAVAGISKACRVSLIGSNSLFLLFSHNFVYDQRDGTITRYVAGCTETIHCDV